MKPKGNLVQDSSPATAAPATLARIRDFRFIREALAQRLLTALAEYEPQHAANRPDLARILVEDALAARASDIHLEPREDELRIRMRIDGAISDVACLSIEQGKWLTNQLKALANLDPVAQFIPKDGHAHLSGPDYTVDLRLAVTPCQQGEAFSIRLLDSKRLERSIDDLGLAENQIQQLESWLESVNGMFLAAGPTGSGKSTTIYALLHELKYADRIAISLEDPVEYEIPGITQVQLDEKHQLSFAEGVKAMLRLDPDFLMIGEIRDSASAHAAVDAAITGRVLLSTIHARDAIGAITALRNWGLPDAEIAESLSVVVAQRLVRRLCPACRRPATPSASEKDWLAAFKLPVPSQVWVPGGCEKCKGIGYHGRTGIFELWRLQESDYRLILAHTDEHTLRQHFHEQHEGGLLRDGLGKVQSGVTSLAMLRRASSGAFPTASLG